MSVTNADTSGRVVKVERRADMAAFDELPPEIRAALNNSLDQHSAIEARHLLARGISKTRLAEILCQRPNTTSTE